MGRGRVKAASEVRRGTPPSRGPVSAPIAIGAAAVLALACLVPAVLWGNPYPEGVVPYWVWGSACVTMIAALAALLPVRAARELPRACAAALMRPSPLGFGALVAGTALSLGIVFAVFVFRRSATTSDELAQLWHAKILLTGRFSLPADPNPEFFALENVIDSGRWYSQFPVGGPLALAAGRLAGVPWLVNPILVGVATAGMYAFARRAFGEMQGRAVAALFSLTPMVLFMAGTWMNHVPVLCLAALTLATLAAWEAASSRTWSMLLAATIGLLLGVMATIRPLDAIIVSVPVGAFQLWSMRHEWRRLGELAVQGLFGVAGAAPVLAANMATTGSALRFGYEVMWGTAHQLGFRVDPYGNVHTVRRALEYAVTYLGELNMFLMAWPAPVLLIVIAGLLALRHTTRWDALLLGLLFTQVVAYASYSLVGEFLGPRFLYTATPTLVVLVARAPFLVGERFGGRAQRAALAFTLACVGVSWLAPTIPYSVWGLAAQARGTRRSLKLDVAGAVGTAAVHDAVVFLREPLGSRLTRRLWGAGLSRSDAARLVDASDGCSLLEALRRVEADSTIPPAARPDAIVRATAGFEPGNQTAQHAGSGIHVSSPASLTAACAAELEADRRWPVVPFGQALPLQPIGEDGRLDGDVIYAADLGEHNEALRARFGHRTWHRLTTTRAPDGSLQARVVPY